MKNYRKIPFENVLSNLRRGKYRGKIMSADYANTGIQLFDKDKFAGNLGVSVDFLRRIGLLKVKEISGWNLTVEPDHKDLLAHEKEITREQNGLMRT